MYEMVLFVQQELPRRGVDRVAKVWTPGLAGCHEKVCRAQVSLDRASVLTFAVDVQASADPP